MSVEVNRPSGGPAPQARLRRILVAAAAAIALASIVAAQQLAGSDTVPASPVDPRAGAVAAAPALGDAPPVVSPPAEVVLASAYIVNSADAAAALRVAIEDADRVRASVGLSPYGDVVVFAANEADADAVEATIHADNAVVAASGGRILQPVRVAAAEAFIHR